jgi:hypothetical protein
MVINSYEQQTSEADSRNSDDSVNQIMEDLVEPEIVLAIEAPPINFLHLEIQPKDLNVVELPDLNLHEAPLELPNLNLHEAPLGINKAPLDQNEMQMVPYAPEQATHNAPANEA